MAHPFFLGRPDPHGRALVLVHGAGGNHALWGPVRAELLRRQVPAVAVDLPGHGRTPGPGRDRVGAYAAFVAAAAAERGITTWAVAGHSLGGAVALTLGARPPPGLVGVGAVCTGARLPVDPMILRGAREAFACTVENLARFCFARGTPEDVWRPAADTLATVGPDVLHGDFAACDRYGLGDADLARIGLPVEVVCGEADVLTPPALSEELARKIPGARLTRIPASGHMPLVEAPGSLAAALERLWERALGAAP